MHNRRLIVFFGSWVSMLVAAAFAFAGAPRAVISAPDASLAEKLAAREVRRYFYLRTNHLIPLESWRTGDSLGGTIVVGTKERACVAALLAGLPVNPVVEALQPEEYLLKTLDVKGKRVVLVVGGDPIGTLYGAYRLAEAMGMRFYLHGDVAPDERVAAELPQVDLVGKPLFALRGILPFHDFPEGPDWWNEDDYKAYIAQLPKMGMNFFGLHTYPECDNGPEPTIWIGPPAEIGEGAKVKASYPSRLFTTANDPKGWAHFAIPTGKFSFGAADIFDNDSYGADVMHISQPWNRMPLEESNALYERVGLMFRDAFTFARKLGVKTCMGTETPLTIPTPVRQRLQADGRNPSDPAVVQEVYEGMFRRIMQTHPLDYYWFWTPEGWTWGKVEQEQIDATLGDLRAVRAAFEKIKPPFTLATCGWVLGPLQSPALFDESLPKNMPMSCINQMVGHSPVEPGFASVSGRPKWAIPWLEDDPGITIPQLWAGRMRRDAADALAYGCTGLFGIHWRTEILGPTVSALAKAAWDQKGWNPGFDASGALKPKKMAEGVEGGEIARFPDNPITGTDDAPLYQKVRYNLHAYRLNVPNGVYAVTLKFCEPYYQEKEKRIFGVKLQDKTVINQLDIFEKVGQNKALDYTFPGVAVTDGQLVIKFLPIVEFPSIAAIAVEGKTAESNQPFSRKINCGGPAYKDYAADLHGASEEKPRTLATDDFYADWAGASFGPKVGGEIAAIFARLDSHLPRPGDWITGPGVISPDSLPWEVAAAHYRFVDELEALAGKVEGPGNRQRYEYWLNIFRLLRSIAHVRCDWGRYNAAIENVKAEKDPTVQGQLARAAALPLRKELIASFAELHKHLLNSVGTPGEMGNVATWQMETLPVMLTQPGEELAQLLGEPLPESARPSRQYAGRPRLFVPTVRTSLMAGEPLKLKVIILGDNPQNAALYWRPLGTGGFRKIPLQHVVRAVYTVSLPPAAVQSDFEYYLRAKAGGQSLRYPATSFNQTVIVAGE